MHIIDTFGELQAQIDHLQAKADKIRPKVIAAIDAGHEVGRHFEAQVVRTTRTFTPLLACKKKLLALGFKRWLRDHTAQNFVQSLIVTRID